MHHNTQADSYKLDVVGHIRAADHPSSSPSDRVVRALQAFDPRIVTGGFRSNVLDAIFRHGVLERFNDDEEYVDRLIPRLERRYGKKRTRQLLIDRCPILHTWRYRDARFIPDAYLLDIPNWTVVCYEIEDTHPLNPNSIEEYAAAWWNLDYIYWDLHLISYDIYGHHRVHLLPIAGFISEEVRRERKKRRDA